MKIREMRLAIALCIVILMPSTAMAAGDSDVTVTLVANKVAVAQNGKETFAVAREAKPGEVLEYRAVYRNQGKQAVHNVLAVLPVPANGLTYIPASASPQHVWASLDGRKFEVAPLVRTVTLPDGKREPRPVPVSEYRYLRWDLGVLKPGAQAVVTARMRMARLGQSVGGVK